MTTMQTQPGGHTDDRGATATLMAGANPAAVPGEALPQLPGRGYQRGHEADRSQTRGVRPEPTNNNLLKQGCGPT